MSELLSKFWILPIVWVLMSTGVAYLLFIANKKSTLDIDGKPRKGMNLKARLSGVVVIFIVVLLALAGGTLLLFREYEPLEQLKSLDDDLIRTRNEARRLEQCVQTQGTACASVFETFDNQLDAFDTSFRRALPREDAER